MTTRIRVTFSVNPEALRTAARRIDPEVLRPPVSILAVLQTVLRASDPDFQLFEIDEMEQLR